MGSFGWGLQFQSLEFKSLMETAGSQLKPSVVEYHNALGNV